MRGFSFLRPPRRSLSGEKGSGMARAARRESGRFEGFPPAAMAFFRGLEEDNSREYFYANREVYLEAVRGPMEALAAEFEEEFGPLKVYRLNRDLRFGNDKTPYKLHQGAFAKVAPHTGWYVQVSSVGIQVGGGFYHAESREMERYRQQVAGPRGDELQSIVDGLLAGRWQVSGQLLTRAPRGYPSDHPRSDLLRRRSLALHQEYGEDPIVATAAVGETIREDWQDLKPLMGWLARTFGAA